MGAAAVLLDLDRTLVDVESQVDYCAALEDLEANDLLAADAVADPASSWGGCTVTAMDVLVNLAGDPRWAEASELIARHEDRGAETAEPMPGLDALRPAIADRPTAVVTLLSPRATARVLERFDLTADVIVPRRPDLRPKPAPDQVLAALRELGTEPADAVMLGDSERDEGAARAAGVAFIGLTLGRDNHRFTAPTTVVADLVAAAAVLGG